MFDEDAYLQILIDEMAMELECTAPECDHGVGGARWKTPPLSEPGALQMLAAHRADAHPVGGGGAARDGGVGEDVHDISEWSLPHSNLQEIPRPVLQRRCSKEDFNFFRRKWLGYVRYYEKVNDSEIRNQLMNCLDATTQIVVYRALGRSFDTTTQAALLWEIEMLVVEDVEKYVCMNITDTQLEVEVDEEHTVEMVGTDMRLVRVPSTKVQPSDDHSFEVNTDRDIVKQYATLHSEEKPSKTVTKRSAKRAAKRARQRSAKYETTAAMVLVDEEQAVMVVSKVVGKDMLQMSDGGQEGGARKKIPKSDPYHKQGGQHHLLEQSGNDGGQEGGAKHKTIPDINHLSGEGQILLQEKLVQHSPKSDISEITETLGNMTELSDVVTREPNEVKMSDVEEPKEGRHAKETVEEGNMSKLCDVGTVEMTAEVQDANVDAEVSAAEEYPAYKLEDTVQSMTLEEVLTATVLAAEVVAEVLDAEDSPKFKPFEVEDIVEEGNMSKLCDVGAVEEYPAYKLEDTVQSMTLEEVLTAEVLAAEVTAEVLAAEDSSKFKPVEVEDTVPDDRAKVLDCLAKFKPIEVEDAVHDDTDEVLDCQAKFKPKEVEDTISDDTDAVLDCQTKFKPKEVEDAGTDDTDVVLDCQESHAVAAQPLSQYAAPGHLAVHSVEDEKKWMERSPHEVKGENPILPEDQKVLAAEVHGLAAEDKALATEDQQVLIAEVQDLAAEDEALAAEVLKEIPAEVLVAEVLAPEDSPEYKHVDEEDTVPADTIQDLNQEENHGHQAAQDLAREEDPGIQPTQTVVVEKAANDNDRVQVPIAAGAGGGAVHADEGDVRAKADCYGGHVRVEVPTDDGDDAALVQAEEESNVAKNYTDDGVGHVIVQANTDVVGGAVKVTERGDLDKIPMKMELCPTGGRDNILRFDKSVDGGGDASVHIPDQYDDGDNVKMQVQDLVAEEGAVHDQVPVDEGGGNIKAAHDETPLDLEADVANKTDASESCDDGAITPETEKAEAEEPKENTQTEVVEIAAPKSQSTGVTAAENAEEPAEEKDFLAMLEQFLVDEAESSKDEKEHFPESRKSVFPGPGSQRGLGEGGPLVGSAIPPGPSPLLGPGSSTVRQHFLNANIDNSLHNEDDFCVENEKVLDDGDWYDATENRHEAVAGQEDADQDIHEDHADTATRDKGDGAENIPVEEIQPRPRKPPDPGCLKFKWISPGLLKAGILLMHFLLMMNPMIMMSGSVMMNTSGDGHRIHEAGFVYKERDTMGDAGVISMKTDLCPTGGRENILRFEKPFDGGGDACVLVKVDEKDVDIVPIDDSGGTEPIRVDDQGDVHARVQVEEGGGAVPVPVDDRGGADHVRVHIAADGGDGPVHTDGGDVMVEAADGGGCVHVPIYEGGAAASDQAEERQDVNQNIADVGDVHDHTHIDEGGGAVQVTEREDVTEDDDNDREVQHTDVGAAPGQGDDGEGDVCVQADQSPGAIKSSRTVMRKPVKRSPPVWQKHVQEPPPDRHDYVRKSGEQGHYDDADKDQGVLQEDEGDKVSGQDGAADDPVDRGPVPAELSKQFGKAESLHTMDEMLMTNQDWFVHAADDGDFAVAKYNDGGGDDTVNATVEKEVDLTEVVGDQGDVQVPAHIDEGGGQVEIKPAVDKDEEGGGSMPTSDDNDAGRLGIMMTKLEMFGHEREGGIAKCTRLHCCAFMLVGNASKLGPRGRREAHLTTAP